MLPGRGPDTALLLMDLQQGIIDDYGGSPELMSAIQRAIRAARSSDMTVIYVRLLFRRGYPEIADSNPVFSAIRRSGRFTEGNEAVTIPAAIAPEQNDVVVTKKRISAFAGSDLEYVLRSRSIRNLVLSGVTTSGVVLSTFRQASDLDFQSVILRDGCADPDADVHRVLLDKVFPRHADVLTVDEWIGRIGVTT